LKSRRNELKLLKKRACLKKAAIVSHKGTKDTKEFFIIFISFVIFVPL